MNAIFRRSNEDAENKNRHRRHSDNLTNSSEFLATEQSSPVVFEHPYSKNNSVNPIDSSFHQVPVTSTLRTAINTEILVTHRFPITFDSVETIRMVMPSKAVEFFRAIFLPNNVSASALLNFFFPDYCFGLS